MWSLSLAVALAADPAPSLDPGAGGALVLSSSSPTGRIADRVAWGDGADLVLLYGGEQSGRVGPCGCEDHPIGGLPRVTGYRRAMRDANPGVPDLLLNLGEFYSARTGDTPTLSSDARAANRWMRAGLDAGPWDAVNVSCRDLPGATADGFPLNALSTNMRVPDLPDHRLVKAGAHTVAVLGVGAPCLDYLQPPGLVVTDPLEAVRARVPTLEADLVVVLVSGLAGRVEALASIDGVDVVLEAGAYVGRYEPFDVGGTVWARSADETQRLKELRLRVDDGRISAATDRTITLDERIPEDRPVKRLLMEPLAAEARVE
ncbi:MAG: hypothetical protein ACI8PZ_006701 [Myxococcota bacterium]|jgi:hypothetical protein